MNRRKSLKFLGAVCLVAIAGAPAAADAPFLGEGRTKGGDAACLTKDLYDQFLDAAVQNDRRAAEYLMDNGCLILRAGLPASVLDLGFMGWAQVRIYTDEGAVTLFTDRGAVVR